MTAHFDPDEGLDEMRCPVCLVMTTVTYIVQRNGHQLCEDCADAQDERELFERMFGQQEQEHQ